jgi:hypothetical protein
MDRKAGVETLNQRVWSSSLQRPTQNASISGIISRVLVNHHLRSPCFFHGYTRKSKKVNKIRTGVLIVSAFLVFSGAASAQLPRGPLWGYQSPNIPPGPSLAQSNVQQDQAALQAAQAAKAKADAELAAAQAKLQADQSPSSAGSTATTTPPASTTDNTTPTSGTGILENKLPDEK